MYLNKIQEINKFLDTYLDEKIHFETIRINEVRY